MTQTQQSQHLEIWDLDFGCDGAVISLRDQGTICTVSDELRGYRDRVRLIVAAPDLLDALEKLVLAIDGSQTVSGFVRNETGAARIAIAKAKGAAP